MNELGPYSWPKISPSLGKKKKSKVHRQKGPAQQVNEKYKS